MSKKKTILKMLDKPNASIQGIAKKLKVDPQYIYTVRWLAKKKTKPKGAKKKKPNELIGVLKETESDVVSPSHYKVGGIETWDFIEAKRLNYNLGNVVKYISRADYKGKDIVDLKKALEYLSREIKRREEGDFTW